MLHVLLVLLLPIAVILELAKRSRQKMENAY